MPETLRDRLARENETRKTLYYLPPFPIDEADMRELAAGRVPAWLREDCRGAVDWALETGPVDFAGMREQQQHQERRSRPKRKGKP